jgi:uncharacterized membrane protein YeaQ/YmgE (transglycosylase-associated protein family)
MLSPRRVFVPLAFFLAGCMPALAYGKNSAFPGFDALIGLIGYDGLQGNQRDLMALLLIVFGLGFGYFAHLAFKEAGFGIIVNAIVGLSGACLALFLLGPKFGLLSKIQGRAHDFVLAVLVAGSAVPTLVVAMLLASLQRRALINFVYGRLRRDIEAKRAAMIEPELPPRVAEMVKK